MKAIMVTTKDNAKFLIDELGDVLEKEDVVIKIVSQKEFDFMMEEKDG